MIIIERKEILEAVKKAVVVINKKNPFPILQNVRIEAREDEKILIQATNLENYATFKIAGNVESACEFTVNAEELLKALKALKTDNVQLEKTATNNDGEEEETVKLKPANGGKGMTFVFNGLNAKDFPNGDFGRSMSEEEKAKTGLYYPDFSRIGEIEAGLLKDVFSKAAYSMSSDDSRPLLCGMNVSFNEKGIGRFTTADGRRMTVLEREVGKDIIVSKKFTLKANVVRHWMKLLKDVDDGVRLEIEAMGKNNVIDFVMLKTDTFEFIGKCIEGNYPDLKNVIPKTIEHLAIVDRKVLEKTAKSVTAFSYQAKGHNSGRHMVKLELRNGNVNHIKLTSCGGNSEASDIVDVEYIGDDMTIGINGSYLSEALNHIESDKVELAVVEDLKPIVITSAKVKGSDIDKYVIMPMRL